MLKIRETVFDSAVTTKATATSDDVNANKQDFVTLTSTSPALKWGRMKYVILSLPDNPFWKNAIAASCLLNFFLGTICFFFERDSLWHFIPIYVLCDLFYSLNVILLSLHLCWKKLKDKFFTVHVSKLVLVLDIISLLPQELLVIAVLGNTTVANYMRWITYVRLRYLSIYFENLRQVLEKRWRNTLLAILINMLVVFHLTTCIVYELSCHHLRCRLMESESDAESSPNNATWFTGRWTQNVMKTFPYYIDAGLFDWYIFCFYISLEYLFNVGTKMVKITTMIEWSYFSFLMMTGYLFFNVWVLFNSFEMMVIAKRTEVNYINKISCIKLYLRDVNISSQVTRNINEYFDILWKKKEGVKSAAHFKSLPSPLQMEIMYDLNCVHLNNSLLLHDLKEFYLRTISLFMQHEFLLPGDILYYQGVVKTKVVIIIKGVLEVLSDEDDESPILAFQAGTVLGEASLFLSLPAKATVRAAVYTEVKLIDRVDFTRNISNYPVAFSYLRERIIFRIKSMKNTILRRSEYDEEAMIPIRMLKNRLLRTHSVTGVRKEHSRMASAAEEEKNAMSKYCTQLLSLYKLSVYDSNVEMPLICLTHKFPFIFDSTSRMIKYWEYLVVAVHFSAVIWFTYQIIFLRRLTFLAAAALKISDTICVVDVVLLTCMTIVLKDRVLQTFKAIISYRIKTIGFYVYALTIFPISDIIELTLSSTNPVYRHRIVELLIGIRIFRFWRCADIFSSSLYSKNTSAFSMLSTVFLLILVSYFLGCLAYLYACFTVTCTTGFWYQDLIMTEVGLFENTFYERSFTTSIYFATSYWLRIGTGVIIPVFPGDLYPVLVIMLSGVVISTYLISTLASTVYVDNTKSEKFVQRVLSFQRFLQYSKVPVDLKSQVSEHFSLQWTYDGSIGRQQFKKMAPEHLQTIVFKSDLMKLLSKVPLFKLADVDFLMHVVISSTITILPSNSTVCYSGDVDREMFIIQKGYCMITDSGGNFVRDMKPGDYYGDIEMLFNMTKTATMRTTTHCKIMVVTFRAFNSALSMFPKEMRIAHKFMYDSDLWAKVDIIEQKRMISFMQMKTEFRSISAWRRILNRLINSFIIAANCYEMSNGREKYWTPYRKLGKWQIIGFFLLPITIQPEALVLKIWIGVRIFLITAMSFCLPLAVGLPPMTSKLGIAVLRLAELTAYVELYLFLHIGYYNKHGLLVSHPLLTAKNYLASNFFMDFVAAFPYYAIVGYVQSDHRDNLDPKVAHLVSHGNYCVWRMMGLLQAYRVIGLFSYIHEDVLVKKRILSHFILLIAVFSSIFLSTTVALISCSFKFSVLQKGDEIDQSTGSILLEDNKRGVAWIGYLRCEKESWVGKVFQCFGSIKNLSYCSFYWLLDEFSHMGGGEFLPNTKTDVMVSFALQLYGTITISYIIYYAATMTGVSGLKSIRYQQKVQELLNFLHTEQMAEVKVNKIFRYFEYVWKRTVGMEAREMLNELHSTLKGDISLFMYEKTLREVAIFQKIARPYLKVLSKNLKEEYFLRSDNIIKSYDVHNSVYIIMRGKVDVFTPYNELLVTIGVGGLFGNIHQAAPSCSTSTFIAQRNVDALRMSSETFFLLAQEYPAINDVLFSVTNIAGDYLLPGQQARKYQSRGSNVFSEVSSDLYEDDIYTDDIDIMSAFSKFTDEEKQEEGDKSEKEKEEEINEKTNKKEEVTEKQKEEGGVAKTPKRIVIPKNTCLVFLMFLKPRLWFKFALEPNHTFFKVVRYATFVVVTYQLYVIPYVCVTGNSSLYITLPSYCFEPIFYLRIFFFFHEAYLDEFGTYERRFKKIAEKYITNYKRIGWDIVPNIPFYLLSLFAPPAKKAYIARILRNWHTLRIKYIADAFVLWSTPLLAKRGRILFVKMAFAFLLTLHFSTLLLHSWFFLYKADVLAKRKFLQDGSPLKFYVFYFHWICNIYSTTGAGEKPVISEEGVTVCVLKIFTKIMFAVLIVFLCTWSAIILQHLLNYEYKVKKLIKFLQNQGLSDHLMRKLWVYVKQMWKTQSGVHIPELLEDAPYVLKYEIMREIYSVHLRKGYLFNGINEALLAQICGHLKRVVFFKGNYIVQNGDTNASMYWIHRGEVSVLTVHANLTETCHEMLRVHDMFGLAQGLNYGMPHKYSYRAETQCDILILKLETWENVLQHFPKDKDIILKRMLSVYTVL